MVKKLLLNFVIIQSFCSEVYANPELESIKKIIAIQQAEIQKLKSEGLVIGSIQQSILTETEFQAKMGTNWVLMDGRSITGSQLATLKGWTNVPNATGRFLRTAGGNAAALATTQDQATAKNGLTVTNNAVTSGAQSADHSHSINHDHPAATTSSYNHSHHAFSDVTTSSTIVESGNIATREYLGGAGRNYTITGSGTKATLGKVSDNVHAHTLDVEYFGGSSGGVSVNHSHSVTSNVVLNAGDIETRPVNLTVNTFIKIN